MEILDVDFPREDAGNVRSLPQKRVPAQRKAPTKAPARKAGAAGRKAFQGEYCEYHGGLTESGQPVMDGGKGCAKFSHLDTSGLGKWKPPLYRRILTFATKRLKAVIIIGFFAAVLWGSVHIFGSTLHIGGLVPKPTDSPVSKHVRHSQTYRVHHRRSLHSNATTRRHSRHAVSSPLRRG